MFSSTPFPRPGIRQYLLIGVVIGLCVAFILLVFQPFGTDRFEHEYKAWILSGYGIVTGLSVMLYYAISIFIINQRREASWTITHEAIDLFLCLILSMMATYGYFIFIFGRSFTLSGMLGFLSVAASVSCLPTLGVFYYIYREYKGVTRSQLEIDESPQISAQITLKGTNKKEEIKTTWDAINYIKADDNYVIIHLISKGEEQKHMIRSTLKLIHQQLDQQIFYQCHRSYIINTRAIESLEGNKNSPKLKLNNSTKMVPVSRSHYDAIKSFIE